MLPPYRDAPTPFGGMVRHFPDGHTEVLVRDFGLTTEPECSEAAHEKELQWFRERWLLAVHGSF